MPKVPTNRKRLDLALKGYRFATVEITYGRPDYRSLLQTFLWQDLDLTTDFPVLKRFLECREKHLDGPLHSIPVTSTPLLRPAEISAARGYFALN